MRFRLYHKDLIDVLPDEDLVELWRELSAIGGFIRTDKTTHDIYVEEIMKYDLDHYISYCAIVHNELLKRKFNVNRKVWNKMLSTKRNYVFLQFDKIFAQWLNSEDYFLIGYYNLMEKYLVGKISQEDWNKIEQRSEDYFNYSNGGKRLYEVFNGTN